MEDENWSAALAIAAFLGAVGGTIALTLAICLGDSTSAVVALVGGVSCTLVWICQMLPTRATSEVRVEPRR